MTKSEEIEQLKDKIENLKNDNLDLDNKIEDLKSELDDKNTYEGNRAEQFQNLCNELEDYLRLRFSISHQCDWDNPILRKFSTEIKLI